MIKEDMETVYNVTPLKKESRLNLFIYLASPVGQNFRLFHSISPHQVNGLAQILVHPKNKLEHCK